MVLNAFDGSISIEAEKSLISRTLSSFLTVSIMCSGWHSLFCSHIKVGFIFSQRRGLTAYALVFKIILILVLIC